MVETKLGVFVTKVIMLQVFVKMDISEIYVTSVIWKILKS